MCNVKFWSLESAISKVVGNFDIEVVEVRDATQEELDMLEQRSCGGCGGGGCGGCDSGDCGSQGCGNCGN